MTSIILEPKDCKSSVGNRANKCWAFEHGLNLRPEKENSNSMSQVFGELSLSKKKIFVKPVQP